MSKHNVYEDNIDHIQNILSHIETLDKDSDAPKQIKDNLEKLRKSLEQHAHRFKMQEDTLISQRRRFEEETLFSNFLLRKLKEVMYDYREESNPGWRYEQ